MPTTSRTLYVLQGKIAAHMTLENRVRMDLASSSAGGKLLTSALAKEPENNLRPLLRKLHDSFLIPNLFVTDADLQVMGFPARRPGECQLSTADGRKPPGLRARSSPQLVRIHFYDIDMADRGEKTPRRDIEVWWVESRLPVTTIEALTRCCTSNFSPIALSFDDWGYGKYLYFAARWRYGDSDYGPFSRIESIRLP